MSIAFRDASTCHAAFVRQTIQCHAIRSHLHERTLTLLQATRGRDPYNVIGEFGGGGLVMCACEVGVVVDVVLVGVVPSSVLPAVA